MDTESTQIDGDTDLADRVRARLGRRHPVAAVATIVNGEVAVCSFGTSVTSDFEIGSVSKGLTALLYVDACERGEVHPTTTLGECLPLRDSPAAGVTLAALATHSSGLPRLPQSAATVARLTLRVWRHGENPYGESVEELLQQARNVRLGPPRPRYSNLGFELLGHAVARRAGTDFQTLLHSRLSEPLGLSSVYAPASPAELGPRAVTSAHRIPLRAPRARTPMPPWTGEALAPAGGIRASIADLATLTRCLLDGSAPGVGALDPVKKFMGVASIGAAWLTLPVRGQVITWHNGATGGFRACVGLDREAGAGVVVLSATSTSVDRYGFTLLAQLAGRDADSRR